MHSEYNMCWEVQRIEGGCSLSAFHDAIEPPRETGRVSEFCEGRKFQVVKE